MALKTMPIAKLQALKTQIETAISAKVTERRRELESELSKLAGFAGGGKAKSGRGGRMGSVAPKYRNPENPTETWAGRGLKPRWLTAAIKGGKKLEDFAIAPGTAASKANGRKKAGGAAAKAKGRQSRRVPNLRLSDHAAARPASTPLPEEEGTALCAGIEREGPNESVVPPATKPTKKARKVRKAGK
jgi:DNA-binding protein H-NS